MLKQRFLFPAYYILFLLPAFDAPAQLKVIILVVCPSLALLINFKAIRRIAILLAAAIGTLAPMLLLVQAAVCTSAPDTVSRSLTTCITGRSLLVLLNVFTLSSIFLLAAANEWRGSLISTINGMFLPREVRVMAIVSIAMIGGFRRSMTRVHHAFTARGDAMPALHWRNLRALPKMVGVVWATELNGIVMRLKGQWSSENFWSRYVPPRRPYESLLTISDILVVAAGMLLFGAWLHAALP